MLPHSATGVEIQSSPGAPGRKHFVLPPRRIYLFVDPMGSGKYARRIVKRDRVHPFRIIKSKKDRYMKKSAILLSLIVISQTSHSQESNGYPETNIAVMGGTFLNDAMFDSGYLKGSFKIETEAGRSPEIYHGEVDGVIFYYIHGHGGGQWVETWSALYHLGVKEVIGGATAGGLNKYLKTYDLVVPDDLLDFNINRPIYIVRKVIGPKAHITARMAPATDPLIQNILFEESHRVLRSRDDLNDVNVHKGGVLVNTRGGRFESVAEDLFFRSIGGDLVTINNGTEMNYARQLGIHYACLNLISNPAEGTGEWEWADIKPVYQRMNLVCLEIVAAAIPRVAQIGDAPRVMDRLLRMDPGFTYKKDAKKAKSAPFPVE